MERLSESESDEDAREDIERRLSCRVLRPAITSLPSIENDPDSEDEGSSSETEVVFSNINWAAEESTGLAYDFEPACPEPAWPTPGAPALATGLPAEGRPCLPDSSKVPRTAASPPSASSDVRAFAVSPTSSAFIAANPISSQSKPRTSAVAQQPSARPGTDASATRDSRCSVSVASRTFGDESYDVSEQYEGRGWLSGAAGRLASVTQRKRAAIAGSDAEQVAAAAADACDLQQLLLQQHQQATATGGSSAAGVVLPDRSPVANTHAGMAAPADCEGEVAAQQQQLLQYQREQEQRLAQDFHDAIEAAESEPPLVASGGFSLEATVAGLGMDDLDALIARLAAGTVGLAVSAPEGPSGACSQGGGPPAAAVVVGAACVENSAASGGLWPWLQLPAAESLWSDDEEEDARAAVIPSPQPAIPSLEDGAQPLAGASAAEAVSGATSAAAQSAEIGVDLGMPSAGCPSARPTHILPAKFKFLAGLGPAPEPGILQHYPSTAPLPPPSPTGQLPRHGAANPPAGGGQGSAAAGPGPVRVDLRQSIAEVVQRNSRDAAAAAAQRESQAKAAAAQRRLLSSDSDSGDSGEEEGLRRAPPERHPTLRQAPTTAPAAAAGAAPVALSAAPRPHLQTAAGALPASSRAPDMAAAHTSTLPSAPTPVVTTSSYANSDQHVSSRPPSSPLAAPKPTQTPALASTTAIKGFKPRTITDSVVTASSIAASPVTAAPPLEPVVARAEVQSVADVGGGGGATAVAPTRRAPATATSFGTDAAYMRPASQSAFVCTAERRAEEQDDEEQDDEEQLRAADIREFLRARVAARAAAEKEEQQQRTMAVAAAEQRLWPEPPAAVAQRISLLAAQRKGEGEAGKMPAKPRAVAAFSCGDGVRGVEVLANGGGASTVSTAATPAAATGAVSPTSSSTSGKPIAGWGEPATSRAAVDNLRPEAGAATADNTSRGGTAAAPWGFAACSTEGDEDLVSEPAPNSVVDASKECGSRRAAAGTVIRLRAPWVAAAKGVPIADGRVTASTGASAPSGCMGEHPGSQPAASIGGGGDGPRTGGARPSALELPSPTDGTAVGAPSLPLSLTESMASPAGGAASAAATTVAAAAASDTGVTTVTADSTATPAAGATRPRAAASPAAPSDLHRLPAWLPQTSCFTLLVTSPNNMTTGEVGAIIAWLLQVAAGGATQGAARSGDLTRSVAGLPPLSVVSVRLLGVALSWPMLPPGAAAAAGGGDVRLLAVACVPRSGINGDAYGHEGPATAAADAAAASVAAQQLTAALAAVTWSAVLQSASESGAALVSVATRSASGVATVSGRGQGQALAGWTSVHPGAQLLFSPWRLPPHVLSYLHAQPRANGPVSLGSVGHDGPVSASGGAGGDGTFACVVSSNVLRNPQLLAGILGRAALVGLTLRGLQVVYATEEAAAAIVASTPHRPLPYTAAAVMALSGSNEPLRRWQDQLGPPDARLAARTDPSSLNALYGEAARHITCSYDSITAMREVAVLFGGGGFGGDAQLAPPSSPSGQGLRSPKAATAAAAATILPRGQTAQSAGGSAPGELGLAAALSGITSAVAPQPQPQWLALPACGALYQALALWCVQHLLWCGYSLRGLLLMGLPGAGGSSSQQNQQHSVCAQPADAQACAPALVLELNKEEGAEQLPLLLTSLPRPPGIATHASTVSAPAPPSSMVPGPAHGAGSALGPGPASGSAIVSGHPAKMQSPSSALLTLFSLLPSDTLRTAVAPADLQSLPQPYIADQLLAAAAAVRQADGLAADGSAAKDAPYGSTPSPSTSASLLHHGEDGIAVVALQSRSLHASALLLAAITMHTTGVAYVASAASAAPSASRELGSQLELVACRHLRQLPLDIASCLTILHPQSHQQGATAAAAAVGGPSAIGSGSTAAAAGTGRLHRAALRLVISQPMLLAVFHGPAAQARVSVLLQAALPRFVGGAGPPVEPADTSAGTGASDVAAWHALLDKLLRDYPTAVTTAGALAMAPPLVAVSGSQANAKRALAYAFAPEQVFLDPGLHDGVHRPPLHNSVIRGASSAAAAPVVAMSPLGRLLTGPERLPAVVAVDFPALHRNVLPRLLKQLRREGYTLHGATTCLVQPGSATAAAMSLLSGQPALVLHVTRSNAVLHLRLMAAALAAVGAPQPPSPAIQHPAGLYTCSTWCDAARVIAEVWPPAPKLAQQQQQQQGAVPPRRFVRPEGSRLLQLTAMLLTPSMAPADGGIPALDWLRFADALDALHAEGFRLAAMRATAATTRDLADLAAASCRISPNQQFAVRAAVAAAEAAATASPDSIAPSCSPPPPPSSLVVLALSRDNAVTSLQILMDEAMRTAAAAGPQGQATAVAGASTSTGLPLRPGAAAGALAPWGAPGRREAAAALAALAPCVSVSHSPAAAEQQVTSVFDGVFGPGGMKLVR